MTVAITADLAVAHPRPFSLVQLIDGPQADTCPPDRLPKSPSVRCLHGQPLIYGALLAWFASDVWLPGSRAPNRHREQGGVAMFFPISCSSCCIQK